MSYCTIKAPTHARSRTGRRRVKPLKTTIAMETKQLSHKHAPGRR